MKTIIAGGRDYWLTLEDMAEIDLIHAVSPITEVVCGMAPGADCGGYFWSYWRLNVGPARFPADWKQNGRAAGPIRNAEMAVYADRLILFPGGKGSFNMAVQAKRYGLKIIVMEHRDVVARRMLSASVPAHPAFLRGTDG